MQTITRLLKAGLAGCAMMCATPVWAQQLPYFDWAQALIGYHNLVHITSNHTNQITTDASGNIYAAGRFTHGIDFDPGPGIDSMNGGPFSGYFAKYDASGNYIWAKTIPGAEVMTIGLDNAGNIFVGGYFEGTVDLDPGAGMQSFTSRGSDDFFIAKYDNSGQYVWGLTAGGAQGDQARSLRVDAAGNIYVSGYIHNSNFPAIDFDPNYPGTKTILFTDVRDGFVASYDNSGKCRWVQHIKGSLGDSGDKLTFDNNGNIIVAGYTSGADFGGPATVPGHGQVDGFVAKYTSSGAYLWAKTYGGPQYEFMYGVAVDKQDNILTTGLFSGNANFDPGNSAANLTPKGMSDIFVAKLSATGDFIWAKGYGSAQDDMGFTITTDDSGSVYTGGYYANTVDFNNTQASSHTSHGASDMYLLKLKKDGSYDWSMGFGGTGPDQVKDILVINDKILFTAAIDRTTDFNPGGSNGLVTINNPNVNISYNTVFCQYTTTYRAPESITSINKNSVFSAYPNPVADQLIITAKQGMSHTEISVADITGKKLNPDVQKQQDRIIINTASLPAGMYLVNCKNTETGITETLKIEKQ